MNKQLLKTSLRNVILAALYILLVSFVMTNGEKLFGGNDNGVPAGFVILLLFTLSAAVVGGLVLGQSIYLFLDGKKKESVTAALYSVASLGAITLLALLAMAIANYL